MKIAIDLSQILYGTGVSHYRENLVKNLLKIDKENEYLLFGGSLRRGQELKTRIENLGTNNKTSVKVFPFPPTLASLVWNKLHILPIEKIIGSIDLIHTSDWAEPPSIYPKVTTIHDLIPLKFPKVTPPAIVAAHKDRLKWVKKESGRIIVPSQTTKNDLIEFGFDENIIKVIYEAPNLKKANEREIITAKAKYRIHDDYIIAIGTNPRKNINRIIDAYNLAKSGKNIKLLIVGEKRGPVHEDQRGVRFLGFVPDHDLGPLLTGSKALIFPSVYEGTVLIVKFLLLPRTLEA